MKPDVGCKILAKIYHPIAFMLSQRFPKVDISSVSTAVSIRIKPDVLLLYLFYSAIQVSGDCRKSHLIVITNCICDCIRFTSECCNVVVC